MSESTTIQPWADAAGALLADEYGLEGTLARLPGENRNFALRMADGRRFVLKLVESEADVATIELEHAAVEAARAAEVGLALPRILETRAGALVGRSERAGLPPVLGRLLEFVEGTPWCQTHLSRSEGDTLGRDLGATLARLDRALAEVHHPAARRTHRWDLTCVLQHRNKLARITDPARKRRLDEAFHLFAAEARPLLAELPRSLIHGDANDENLIVADGRVVGLLDFGDCLENPTVCELAIALAYAMLDAKDPVALGRVVVAGYHEGRALTLDELRLLPALILGRLAATVTIAAERRAIDPGRTSWFVTEEGAWRLLERLGDMDPADLATALAADTGLDPHAERGPSAEELAARRARHVGSALSVAYRDPIAMVRGRGQYLFDDRGRPYLDLVNNVCHVGHCHPRVVAAGQDQMARLNTNTRYLYEGLSEYTERLCATLPPGLDVCYLVNSGSEANELALRLARAHTNRRDVLVVEGAYHGHTAGLIAISPYKFLGRGGSGHPEPWVHMVPIADGYRGAHRGHDHATGVAYGDEVARVIERAPTPIAAFICESILSCGGQVVPPPGYLATTYAHIRAAGGLCIADEVQVGFGRVGTHFWGFELQDVVPDIVVMGKPIGNGHPMAAVVTTREIAASFDNGMEFFATFGGNPVSCAIGLAVLDVVRDEGLQARALDLGRRLREGLAGLAKYHPLIGEVRGRGLFLGLELVRDHETLEPAAREADELVNRLRHRGVLLSTDGPLHNVLKIKPPMVIDEGDVDRVVRLIDEELG